MPDPTLKIGSGINRIGTNIAQVITTNGNLHLDCGTNSKSIKINSSNTSFATFIGGPINIHSLQFDQNVSSFSNIVYNETNKLYLVDFGFAKRYNYYGTHIEEKSINKIVGSPNFVSLNVHNLIEPSRRDDIESCIYIILTMLLGKLEWFHKSNIIEIANLKKEIISNDEIPSFIKNMLYYIRQLDFNEKPDYEYLIKLMMTELDKYNI